MRNKILNALPFFIILGGWVVWLTKSGMGEEFLQSIARGEPSWWIWIQMFAPMFALVFFILPVIGMGGMAGLYEFYKALFYDIASVMAKLFKNREKQAEWSGQSGECLVNAFLLNLPQRDYYVEHDLLLRTADGRTVQIDHMVISQYGVFVIETKSYNCTIDGTEKDFKWTMQYRKKTYQVQNPVRQNEGHIKALQAITRLPENAFFNIVVLLGNMKFKKELSDDRFKGGWDTKRFIRKQKILLFSHTQKGEIIDAIKKARDTSEGAKQKHIDNLRERRSAEKHVAESPQQSYTVLKKLQVSVDGCTMAIDRVVFSPYGIFVIADINHNNYIYGEELRLKWANKPSPQETNFFDNPLLQNKKYIEALRTITKLPEEVFFNMVVFAENAQLKTRERLPESVCVGKSGMKVFMDKQKQHRLSDKQLETTLNVVRNAR